MKDEFGGILVEDAPVDEFGGVAVDEFGGVPVEEAAPKLEDISAGLGAALDIFGKTRGVLTSPAVAAASEMGRSQAQAEREVSLQPFGMEPPIPTLPAPTGAAGRALTRLTKFPEAIGPQPQLRPEEILRGVGQPIPEPSREEMGLLPKGHSNLEATGDVPIGLGKFEKIAGKTKVPVGLHPKGEEGVQPGVALPSDLSYVISLLPEGKVKDISAGTYNALASFVNFFGSPQGWAALGIGSLPVAAQRAITAKFAVDMFKSAPQQLMAGADAFNRGDILGATENWVGGAGGVVLGGVLAKHTVAPFKLPKLPPQELRPIREGEPVPMPGTPDVAITGESLKLPPRVEPVPDTTPKTPTVSEILSMTPEDWTSWKMQSQTWGERLSKQIAKTITPEEFPRLTDELGRLEKLQTEGMAEILRKKASGEIKTADQTDAAFQELGPLQNKLQSVRELIRDYNKQPQNPETPTVQPPSVTGEDLFPDLKGKAPTLERVRRAIVEAEADLAKIQDDVTNESQIAEIDLAQKRVDRLRELGLKLEKEAVQPPSSEVQKAGTAAAAANVPTVGGGTTKAATPLVKPTPPTEGGASVSLDKTTEFINKGLSGQVGESQLGGGLGGVSATSKSKAVTEDIPVKAENLRSSDPKVEERWQSAKLAKQSLWQKGKNAFIRSKNAMQRHFPKLDSETDGATINLLRVHEGTPLVSQYMASNAIRGITSDLGPRKYGVFERIVILRDLISYGEKFLTENKELPFGYTGIDAMRTDLARFEAIGERFPDIKEAVRRRNEFIEALRDDLVSRNLLPKEVKDFPAYFHHQVLEHMAMKESATPGTGASDVRTHRKGWQRKRVGSSKDFNTSYLESEFEVVSQSFAQMMTQDTLKRIEAVADISESLKDAAARLKEEGRDVDWRSLVPRDHTLWQPTRGNHFYWAQSLTEKALESFLRGEKELTRESFNEILALGEPRKQWVIPKRLAETLDNFGPQKDHAIEKFIGMGQSQWKRWTLFNPMRNLIYELNNLSGDADISFAVDPKIFSHTPKASTELWKFVVGKKAATPKIDYLIKQGVIDAGFSVHELPDLKGQQFFRVLSGQEPGLIAKYWDTVLDFNRWREGVLRYAAYERALERLDKGENIYWTSKRSEIDTIRQDPNVTNQEIAAKLSREAIGDYGNISHAGQWIRSKAIPFYSWMEINAPRYVRLFKNVANEPGARGRAGTIVGKRLAVGAAKTTAKAAALYLLINLWNKTMFPDEEDELGLNQKQLHVILGRRENGSIISLRLQGALSDALGWFGAENVIKDVQDVATGRASVGDKLIESAKAPVNRIAGGSFPIQKTLVEATLGRQTYPDVFDPRQVRDPGKHIAKLFSVGTVYDYLTKKPQRPGTWSPLSLVTYTTDPGEAAYYASKAIVSDWMNDNNKDRPETMANDKANALYYHKQAIKYKDKKLAEFWKKKYFDLDGTTKGLNQSIAKSAPTAAVAAKDKAKFKNSLSPTEKQIIDRAEKWYKTTYQSKNSEAVSPERFLF